MLRSKLRCQKGFNLFLSPCKIGGLSAQLSALLNSPIPQVYMNDFCFRPRRARPDTVLTALRPQPQTNPQPCSGFEQLKHDLDFASVAGHEPLFQIVKKRELN